MTTERWTDDMLDRLASTTTRVITHLTDLTEKNTQDISRLESSVERLVSVTQTAVIELQRQGEDIREMQAEVRGLQTENRRILDQLINREGNGA